MAYNRKFLSLAGLLGDLGLLGGFTLTGRCLGLAQVNVSSRQVVKSSQVKSAITV